MTREEVEEWARVYISAQQDPDLLKKEDHPQFWAVEKFMDAGLEDEVSAEDCWSAILTILAHEPPETVIGELAAGPLEDLIGACGEDVIEDIEEEARRNPSFRHLLGGVWKSSTEEVWSRIEACRGNAW